MYVTVLLEFFVKQFMIVLDFHSYDLITKRDVEDIK